MHPEIPDGCDVTSDEEGPYIPFQRDAVISALCFGFPQTMKVRSPSIIAPVAQVRCLYLADEAQAYACRDMIDAALNTIDARWCKALRRVRWRGWGCNRKAGQGNEHEAGSETLWAFKRQSTEYADCCGYYRSPFEKLARDWAAWERGNWRETK